MRQVLWLTLIMLIAGCADPNPNQAAAPGLAPSPDPNGNNPVCDPEMDCPGSTTTKPPELLALNDCLVWWTNVYTTAERVAPSLPPGYELAQPGVVGIALGFFQCEAAVADDASGSMNQSAVLAVVTVEPPDEVRGNASLSAYILDLRVSSAFLKDTLASAGIEADKANFTYRAGLAEGGTSIEVADKTPLYSFDVPAHAHARQGEILGEFRYHQVAGGKQSYFDYREDLRIWEPGVARVDVSGSPLAPMALTPPEFAQTLTEPYAGVIEFRFPEAE